MSILAMVDYDGTIAYDFGGEHLPSPALLPTVLDGFDVLRDAGVRLAVVTNQPDRVNNFESPAVVAALDASLEQLMGHGTEAYPIHLLLCPHERGVGCTCRKPMPGLLQQAIRDQPADHVWMVGDKWSDIAAGVGAGANTILVGTPYPYVQSGSTPVSFSAPPDYRVNTFLQAAELVVALSEMRST